PGPRGRSGLGTVRAAPAHRPRRGGGRRAGGRRRARVERPRAPLRGFERLREGGALPPGAPDLPPLPHPPCGHRGSRAATGVLGDVLPVRLALGGDGGRRTGKTSPRTPVAARD